MDVYQENKILRDRLSKARKIIGGHSVFVVMRRWHEPEIHATVYRKGESQTGTFIQLVMDVDDLAKVIKAEMEAGRSIDEALKVITEEVKAASSEVLK